MKAIYLIAILVVLSGCAQTKYDMTAFNAAPPRSILVVPVVNKSLDVDAPNYVLTTLPFALAEKGYYVFPVNTTKYVLEQEGFYEGEQIQNQPTAVLAKLFGSDAVLYVTINRWDAKFLLISTSVTVEFDYRLVNKDGIEIWKENKQMVYNPGDTGSLLGNILVAIATRASPNYMPLARQANQQVFVLGNNAIPNGPYKLGHVK